MATLVNAARLRREPVLRLWADGYTCAEIAEATGVTRLCAQRIVKYAREIGDPRAMAGDDPARVARRQMRPPVQRPVRRPPSERQLLLWGRHDAHTLVDAVRLRHEPVLRLWATGRTGGQIAEATGIPRNSVLRIVRVARMRGDPRAVSRPVPQSFQREGKYA